MAKEGLIIAKEGLIIGATVVGMIGVAAYLNWKDNHAHAEKYMAHGICPVCGIETGVNKDGYCEFCQHMQHMQKYSAESSATSDFQAAILENWRETAEEPKDEDWKRWKKEFNMDDDEMGAVYTDLMRQIERGIEIEVEHEPTLKAYKENPQNMFNWRGSNAFYRSIAIDHLLEFPDYYIPRLDDMEEQAKKDWA